MYEIDNQLISRVAKFIYISRNFTDVSLIEMNTYNLPRNWPDSEYKDWNSLSIEYRAEWLQKARKWLDQLKNKRPTHLKVLVENSIDVDP